MNPWYSLEGKTIWVIGAAGYLGAPITEALDGMCGKVICSELEGRAAALVREKNLTRTAADSLDVTDLPGLPGAIERVLAEHGVPDGLVYMVAASSRDKRLEELPLEVFQKTLDHALSPAFLVCRAVAERMKARGSGSIVIFSSMYGVVAPDPRIYRWNMKPNPIDYGASSKPATARVGALFCRPLRARRDPLQLRHARGLSQSHDSKNAARIHPGAQSQGAPSAGLDSTTKSSAPPCSFSPTALPTSPATISSWTAAGRCGEQELAQL